MGKHRDRLNIIASILDACNTGACKTRVMTDANLSFKHLEKYLDKIRHAGLIEVRGQTYSLTQRGEQFLKQYKHYRERYVTATQFLEHLGSEYEHLLRSFESLP